jgi:hypothetical protein
MKEKIKSFKELLKLLFLREEPKLPRKLTEKEAEWVADYFHGTCNEPDYDGYVGNYSLPLEVMEIYIKKYA